LRSKAERERAVGGAVEVARAQADPEGSMGGHDTQSTIDAIAALAEEIARASPESADKALEIRNLAKGLESQPDVAAITDAIDAGTNGELSDARVRSASAEVARSLRDEP
jgi:hypothetical protein